MCPEAAAPAFEEFLKFVAWKSRSSPSRTVAADRVLAAARAARLELRASPSPPDRADCEVLELLAAASADTGEPPELITVRGFRVRLAYRDGSDSEPSSICVLVQCPEQWLEHVQGRVAYLWSGTERFALGEFDAEGKAIGTLPAGIEITLDDLATGRIRLEAPEVPARE